MLTIWSQHETPGSHGARRLGCRCSAVLNCYGRGHGDYERPLFQVADDCPVHANSARDGYRVERALCATVSCA